MLTSSLDEYFGARIEEERGRLGLSQAETAEKCGVRREMWGRYELGKGLPSIGVLAPFARAGADVLYILTGRRARPVAELTDHERLAAALEAVEEGLAGTRRRLDPARKAELILAAYDLLDERADARAKARVIRLVKAA